MTDKSRDRGRAIAMGLLVMIMLVGMCSSCTVYKTPKLQITHVLAVTATGDTLKLPIDVIRPIYNYNTYPTNRYPIGYGNNTFYYNPHRYQPVYGNSNYKPIGSGNNNNNPNTSQSGNSPAPRVDRSGTGGNVNAGNPAQNNPRKNN